jgi:hypothetical protein
MTDRMTAFNEQNETLIVTCEMKWMTILLPHQRYM